MKFNYTKNQKQFGINISSNIIAYAVNLLIGLWLTPYLISNLGVENYGLYPLANSITSYMSLITLALNGAVGRYLAIEIQKKDFDNANKTFNTALFGSILLAAFSLPFIIGFVLLIPYIFNIPTGQETNTQILFLLIMVSFFVTTIESSFSVSTWAKNRFDLRNAIIISKNIVRLIVIIIMFKVVNPIIWIIGFAIFFSSIFGIFGDILIWNKLTPELRISTNNFDKKRIRILFSMGIWMLINQIGTLLFLNIDMVVANIGLGAKIAGEYGSIIIFSSVLRGLASTISGVLTPIVLAKYALNEINRITKLSSQAVRLLGIAIGLPVGYLIGFGKPFLGLWLGKNFESLWLLLVVMIIHLPINLSVLPLFSIQVTLNKVKIPGIITFFMGVINLVLAILFISVFNLGVYGIALAAAIILTSKNAIFTPLYAAKIQKIPWFTFMTAIIPGLLVTIITSLFTWIPSLFFIIDSWIKLISVGIIIGLFLLIIIYSVILNKEDKKLINSFIPSNI